MVTLDVSFETENMRNNKTLLVRITNRGILLNGSKILLSYEKQRDLWMIPGECREDN